MARSSRTGKVLKWTVIAVVILAVLYAAGWFFIARTVKARIFALLEGTNGQDVVVQCSELGYQGFPVNFGFSCRDLHVRDRATNMTADLPGLLARAPVYSPWAVETTLEGPLTLDSGHGVMVRSEWSALGGKMIYGDDAPRFLSFSFEDMTTRFSNADDQEGTLTIEGGEGLTRDNEGDLDVALSISNAILRPQNKADALDPVSINLNATVENGGAMLGESIRLEALRGKSGIVDQAMLTIGTHGSHVALSGPYSFDAQGYLSGNFKVELAGIDILARAIGIAIPESANAVNTIAGLVNALASGQKSLAVTVKVDGGKASMGFIRLGRLPPI